MIEINPIKGIIFALEEALMNNLETIDTVKIDVYTPEQVKEIWASWKKQLEDEKRDIVPFITENIFNVYHEIATSFVKTYQELDEIIAVSYFGNRVYECIEMAKNNMGLPSDDLPPLLKIILESKQNDISAKKIYCRHSTINSCNRIAIEHPEYGKISIAFKKRCEICPLYSSNGLNDTEEL